MRVTTGLARGRTLVAPQGMDTRPSSDMTKQAVFNIIQNYVEGCTFLDLFAGSGQMGIEALSRGAKHAVFVDAASKAVEAVRANLKSTTTRFDIVFLDPPYQQKIIDAVLPMVVGQMAPQGIILCETERNEQLPESAGDYEIAKTYFYGKAKITAYRRKEGQEEE